MKRGRPRKCPKCPQCGSTKSRSRGFKYRANGRSHDRQCRDCGRRYLVTIA